MKTEISTWSIVRIVLVLLTFWIIWQVHDILVLFFIAVIVGAALGPSVTWLTHHRVPRLLAVSLTVLALIIFVGLILALIIPGLISQLQTFVSDQFPSLVERLTPYYNSVTSDESVLSGKQFLNNIVNQLEGIGGSVLGGIVSLFGGLFSTFTVVILSFYWLLDEKPLREAGINLMPAKYRHQLGASLHRVNDKLGAWLRGQFALSLIVGTLTAAAMTIIGVPAPLALGVLAALLEIVPVIGPTVTSIAIVIMAAVSPEDALLKVILAVVFFVLMQFLESNFLVPNIMRKAIGLSPVIIIFALLVGGELGGIAGAILAIPVAAIIQVVLEDWPKLRLAGKASD